ncbi:hypothetical protein [Nocardia sp. NPDC059239]|uniref:hypothetical protein n=1 Tax=Nocardia sp. NPDC059239 TaxID=3346785 RepID=UPI0036CA3894
MSTTLSTDRAEQLRAVLTTACTQVGLSAHGATLIKYTVNAVYRLRIPVIARIGAGHAATPRGHRQVAAQCRCLTPQVVRRGRAAMSVV